MDNPISIIVFQSILIRSNDFISDPWIIISIHLILMNTKYMGDCIVKASFNRSGTVKNRGIQNSCFCK